MKKVGAVFWNKAVDLPCRSCCPARRAPYLVTDAAVRARRRLCLMGGPVRGWFLSIDQLCLERTRRGKRR